MLTKGYFRLDGSHCGNAGNWDIDFKRDEHDEDEEDNRGGDDDGDARDNTIVFYEGGKTTGMCLTIFNNQTNHLTANMDQTWMYKVLQQTKDFVTFFQSKKSIIV